MKSNPKIGKKWRLIVTIESLVIFIFYMITKRKTFANAFSATINYFLLGLQYVKKSEKSVKFANSIIYIIVSEKEQTHNSTFNRRATLKTGAAITATVLTAAVREAAEIIASDLLIAGINRPKYLTSVEDKKIFQALNFPFRNPEEGKPDFIFPVKKKDLLDFQRSKLQHRQSKEINMNSSNSRGNVEVYTDDPDNPTVAYSEYYITKTVTENSTHKANTLPHETTKLAYQTLSVKVADTPAYDIWVEAFSNQKPQNHPELQGGTVERGDIRFKVVSKDLTIAPVGINVNFTELFLSGDLDIQHLVQLFSNSHGRVNHSNTTLYTDEIGSLVRILGDFTSIKRILYNLLRNNSQSDFEEFQKDVDQFVRFALLAACHSEVLFQFSNNGISKQLIDSSDTTVAFHDELVSAIHA